MPLFPQPHVEVPRYPQPQPSAIDFPKEHGVSIAFEDLAKRLDIAEWFRRKVPEIVKAVAELAEMRGLADYGFEQGIGVEYFKDYAPEAFKTAKEVHEACSKLLGETFKT